MVSIFRVVTNWQGFQGAPGYTNLFFRNIISDGAPGSLDERGSALLAQDRVHDFFSSVAGVLPDEVRLKVETTVDVLEDSTGELTGSFNAENLPIISGVNDAGYSAASGAVISWQTATIRKGRRIRGRTFLVPLSGASFTGAGRIGPNSVENIQQAANALVNPAGLNTFGVWARPSAKGASDGVWAPARAARTSDLPAVLRSRRD